MKDTRKLYNLNPCGSHRVIYLFKHQEPSDPAQVVELLEEERWARSYRYGELPLIGPNRLPKEFLRAAA